MQAQVDMLKSDIKSSPRPTPRARTTSRSRTSTPSSSGGKCDVLIVSPQHDGGADASGRGRPARSCRSSSSTAACRPSAPSPSSTRSAATDGAFRPRTSSSPSCRRAARCSACASCPASTCWRPAGRREAIFKANNVNVVGAEFTGGDNAKTKAIVEDYINRFGKIDAIWMDAGATAVAAIEAFEDAGRP